MEMGFAGNHFDTIENETESKILRNKLDQISEKIQRIYKIARFYTDITTTSRYELINTNDLEAPGSKEHIDRHGNSSMRFIALDNIEAGTLLFSDLPSVIFPSFKMFSSKDYEMKLIDTLNGVSPTTWNCTSCLKPVGSVFPGWCIECGIPTCSRCQVDHQFIPECKIFREANDKYLKTGPRRFLKLGYLYQDIAIARFLMLEYTSKEFEALNALIADNPTILRFIASSAQCAQFLLELNEENYTYSFYLSGALRRPILRAFAILSTQSHMMRECREIGAYHPVLTLFRHDCFPNCEIYIDRLSLRTEIRASRYIMKFEELCFDYLQEPMLPNMFRMRLLKSGWGVSCDCRRCSDPSEFGTFFGSVLCPHCKEGYLIPLHYSHDEMTPHSVLTCVDKGMKITACGLQESHSFVLYTEEVALEKIKKVEKNEFRKHKLYQDYRALRDTLIVELNLHEEHYLVVALTEKMVGTITTSESRLKRRGEFEERMGEIEKLISLVSKMSSLQCRNMGYALYHKALCEKQLMDLCGVHGVKTYAEVLTNLVSSVFPTFLHAWRTLLIYKFPADYHVLEAIGTVFINENPVNLMRKIQREMENPDRSRRIERSSFKSFNKIKRRRKVNYPIVTLFHYSNHRKKRSNVSRSSSDTNVIRNKLMCNKNKNRDGDKNSSFEETSHGSESELSDSVSSSNKSHLLNSSFMSSKNETENVTGTSLSTPDTPNKKRNKLKEALIKRQAEMRKARQKQLVRQIFRSGSRGSNTSASNLSQSTSKNKIYELKKSASVGDLNLEAPSTGGETVRKSELSRGQTPSQLMSHPIPVHHSLLKGRNIITTPKRQRTSNNNRYGNLRPVKNGPVPKILQTYPRPRPLIGPTIYQPPYPLIRNPKFQGVSFYANRGHFNYSPNLIRAPMVNFSRGVNFMGPQAPPPYAPNFMAQQRIQFATPHQYFEANFQRCYYASSTIPQQQQHQQTSFM